MFCPFKFIITQQTQNTFVYDEGQNTLQGTVLTEKQDFGECYKEKCAMWQDNKCGKQ